MKRKKLEIIVGLFMVGVLIVLGAMTAEMGKIKLSSRKGYTLYAAFSDVSGLYKNAKVRIAGVEVGSVSNIFLKYGKAIVAMKIARQYKIPINSTAIIRSEGFLGEKYVEIKLGNAKKYLTNGEYIRYGVAGNGFNALMTKANKLLNKHNRQNIAEILKEFKQLGKQLNELISENRKNVSITIQQAKISMKNLKQSLEYLKEILKENRSNVKETVVQARRAMEELNKVLQNISWLLVSMKQGKGTIGQLLINKSLYNNLNETTENVKQIAQKINSGKGTIGKLINDNALYNNLNDTLVDIKNYLRAANRTLFEVYGNTEYNFKNDDTQNSVGVKIYTTPDRFYKIGAVVQRNYKNSPNPSGPESNVVRFTALMGKRYYNFVVKGGVIQSTVGVGADYYTLGDKLKFGIEAFDFSHRNDIRDRYPQLKAKISYTFLQHFTLFGGVNEILNTKSRSIFVGGGVDLYNSDLKYAIGSAASAASLAK